MPFLSESMKIEKIEELVANLHDKIDKITWSLNHGLIFKKFYRVIHFNQKVLLKPYIDMNTTLREKRKKNFKK